MSKNISGKPFALVERQGGFERDFDSTAVEVTRVIEGRDGNTYLQLTRLGDVSPKTVLINAGALVNAQAKYPKIPALVNADTGEPLPPDFKEDGRMIGISPKVAVGAERNVLHLSMLN